MPVYVNTNYSALQGQRYLGNVQNSLTTTYQRLSSGMRINSAKDCLYADAGKHPSSAWSEPLRLIVRSTFPCQSM